MPLAWPAGSFGDNGISAQISAQRAAIVQGVTDLGAAIRAEQDRVRESWFGGIDEAAEEVGERLQERLEVFTGGVADIVAEWRENMQVQMMDVAEAANQAARTAGKAIDPKIERLRAAAKKEHGRELNVNIATLSRKLTEALERIAALERR